MWENKEQKHRNRKSFGANTITSEKAHFVRFITTAQKDLGEGLRGTASPLRVEGSPGKRAAERRARRGEGEERQPRALGEETVLCSKLSASRVQQDRQDAQAPGDMQSLLRCPVSWEACS